MYLNNVHRCANCELKATAHTAHTHTDVREPSVASRE